LQGYFCGRSKGVEVVRVVCVPGWGRRAVIFLTICAQLRGQVLWASKVRYDRGWGAFSFRVGYENRFGLSSSVWQGRLLPRDPAARGVRRSLSILAEILWGGVRESSVVLNAN
jgi:hypothetical protein